MAEEHYTEFKKNIAKRDEHKAKAERKRTNASKIPVVKTLDNWLASRHEAKAQKHQDIAYEAAGKHADALKKKHKL